MYPQILSRCINWENHASCSVEVEEHGEEVRVFLCTRKKDIIRRVCLATLYLFRGDPHQEVPTLGRLIDALMPDMSVVSISGASTILVETFCECRGKGYRHNRIDYPCFDCCLFKRCWQRTACSVFDSLDGFAIIELIVNWLKGAETRDWMSSRPALKKAILRNDLCLPHFGDIVANIISVWPLIVSFLRDTGPRYDGDCLVVRSSSFYCNSAHSYSCILSL